jgi:hypothetical protein
MLEVAGWVDLAKQSPSLSVDMDGLNDVLSDLCLTDVYKLCLTVRRFTDEIRNSARKGTWRSVVVRLTDYDCGLCFVSRLEDIGSIKVRKVLEQWARLEEAGHIRYGLRLVIDCQTGGFMGIDGYKRHVGGMETMLNRWDGPPVFPTFVTCTDDYRFPM